MKVIKYGALVAALGLFAGVVQADDVATEEKATSTAEDAATHGKGVKQNCSSKTCKSTTAKGRELIRSCSGMYGLMSAEERKNTFGPRGMAKSCMSDELKAALDKEKGVKVISETGSMSTTPGKTGKVSEDDMG